MKSPHKKNYFHQKHETDFAITGWQRARSGSWPDQHDGHG
jgi:hypothetical protein